MEEDHLSITSAPKEIWDYSKSTFDAFVTRFEVQKNRKIGAIRNIVEKFGAKIFGLILAKDIAEHIKSVPITVPTWSVGSNRNDTLHSRSFLKNADWLDPRAGIKQGDDVRVFYQTFVEMAKYWLLVDIGKSGVRVTSAFNQEGYGNDRFATCCASPATVFLPHDRKQTVINDVPQGKDSLFSTQFWNESMIHFLQQELPTVMGKIGVNFAAQLELIVDAQGTVHIVQVRPQPEQISRYSDANKAESLNFTHTENTWYSTVMSGGCKRTDLCPVVIECFEDSIMVNGISINESAISYLELAQYAVILKGNGAHRFMSQIIRNLNEESNYQGVIISDQILGANTVHYVHPELTLNIDVPLPSFRIPRVQIEEFAQKALVQNSRVSVIADGLVAEISIDT